MERSIRKAIKDIASFLLRPPPEDNMELQRLRLEANPSFEHLEGCPKVSGISLQVNVSLPSLGHVAGMPFLVNRCLDCGEFFIGD